MRIKNKKQDTFNEENEGRIISDLELPLVLEGLSVSQARRTLELIPNSEEALKMVEYYWMTSERDFANYNIFLEGIRYAMRKKDTPRGLYEEEILERTSLVPKESLFSTSYRDKPHRSAHFYEHLATQLLG
ncbi:MAG: hypothetical protein KKC19_00960 [Nanoarchaeota archaeon]|nr:hypothetical protein [Nanoarchaeota archaeon]